MNLLEPADLTPPPENVVAAVEASYQRQPSGTRLTAADLAAQAGIGIEDARLGMRELATALAGAEGVSVSASQTGDLLYTFPTDVRKELASRSNAAKARDAWNAAKPVLQGIGRFGFGLALFVSIAVIYTAIAVLQSSSDERDDDGGGFRGEARGGSMLGGGPFGGGFGFGYGFSPLDILFPPWPYGYYGYGWFSPPPRMSLPEAIFSFVFGDGDPNTALRAARVRAMAEVIRANDGAVVAESLAPFLDPPSSPTSGSYNVDESWVLPAVTELGGRPEVSDDGTIVYVFDDLTVSAVASQANLILADPALATIDTADADKLAELARDRSVASRGTDAGALRNALRKWAGDQLELSPAGRQQQDSLFPEGYLEERLEPFSNAEGGQLFAAGALGLLNLGGAAYLGSLLADLPPGVRLGGDLALLQAGFPFLAAYAVAFLGIPAARYVALQASNAQIEQRNANRRAWRDALRRGGDEMRRRLDAAGSRRKRLRLVGEDDVAYDSAKGLGEQAEEQQPGLDDFDRRLRDATGGK